MLVPRHRSLAGCSSSVVVEELASFSRPLRRLLEVVVYQSAALRKKEWGCSVFAVVAAATMPLATVELEEMRVFVSIQRLSGRSVAVTH